jgi:hypothetical protein
MPGQSRWRRRRTLVPDTVLMSSSKTLGRIKAEMLDAAIDLSYTNKQFKVYAATVRKEHRDLACPHWRLIPRDLPALLQATGFQDYSQQATVDLVFCPNPDCGRWARGTSSSAGQGQCDACGFDLFKKNKKARSRTRYMTPIAVATDIANNPALAAGLKEYHPVVSSRALPRRLAATHAVDNLIPLVLVCSRRRRAASSRIPPTFAICSKGTQCGRPWRTPRPTSESKSWKTRTYLPTTWLCTCDLPMTVAHWLMPPGWLRAFRLVVAVARFVA